MNSFQKSILSILFLIIFAGSIITPTYAALGDRLVPCGNGDISDTNGMLIGKTGLETDKECNTCHLQVLAMNILDFFVLISAVVGTLLFVNAGVLYIMSSANPGNIAKAHKIFMSTLVGMIIIFASWLLINTIMSGLVDKAPFTGWNNLLCTGDPAAVAPPASTAPASVVAEEALIFAVGPGYDSGDLVASASYPVGSVLSDSAIAGGLSNIDNNCDVGSLSCKQYIIDQANAQGVDPNYALALATVESGGCADPATCTSPVGAVGVIQLMPATARAVCGNDCIGKSDAEMKVLLSDPANNIKWGVAYMKESSDYVNSQMVAHPERFDSTRKMDYMAAYYNGGATALQASADCGPTKTKYECTVNPGGYVETQSYVDKMNTYVNSVDRTLIING